MAVKQNFEGDASGLLKEIEKLKVANAKLEESIKKIGKVSVDVNSKQLAMGDHLESAGRRGAASIAGMVTGYMSLQSVLGLITKEIEHQDKLQENRRRAAMTIGQAQGGMVANLGVSASSEEAKLYAAKVNILAAKHGIDPVLMAQGASSALAGSGANQKLSLAALDAVAPAFKADPSQLPEFVQFVPSIMAAMGTEDANEAAAMMASIRSQSRIINPSAFKNVAKALSMGMIAQKGAPKDEALAATASLVSGMGFTMNDPEASQTGVAVNKLSNALALLVPDSKMDSLDRLDVVRKSSKLQKALLKDYGENETTNVVRGLLDPDSDVSRMVSGALPNIRSSVSDYKQYIDNLQHGSPQLALTTMANENAAKQMIRDSLGGFDAERKGAHDRALDRTPSWLGISRTVDKFAYGLTEGGLGIDALESRLNYYAPGGEAAPGREGVVADIRASIQEMKAAEAGKAKYEGDMTRLMKGIEQNTKPGVQQAGAKAGDQRNVHQESDAGAQ